MTTDYDCMLEFVRKTFYTNGGDKKEKKYQSFRSRFSHTKRVLRWCERLSKECDVYINEYILFVSAIFHDIGYAILKNETLMPHAEASAQLFRNYCDTHEVPYSSIIENNISLHSNKDLLKNEDISIELVLLMEADLLDETGALSIMFDCMSSGERHLESYEEAYLRVCEFSCRILESNPMVTPGGIRIWKEKQELVRLFVSSLKFDLCIDKE